MVNYDGTGFHCDISRLASALVPDYVNEMPDLSSLPEDSRVQYASGVFSRTPRDGYGLVLESNGERICRYLAGSAEAGWFDQETPFCE